MKMGPRVVDPIGIALGLDDPARTGRRLIVSATPTIAVIQLQDPRGQHAAETAKAGCLFALAPRIVSSVSLGNLRAVRLNRWNSGSGMFLTGRFMSFRTSNANTIPSIFTFLSFSQHPGLVARTTDAFRNAQKFCRKGINAA
jgi:hypothetical protein